jgi:hypothetical protein
MTKTTPALLSLTVVVALTVLAGCAPAGCDTATGDQTRTAANSAQCRTDRRLCEAYVYDSSYRPYY